MSQTATRQGPPEEAFWVRYSPHHELPLSAATSTGLHLLVIGLLGLAAWFGISKLFPDDAPLPIVAVQLEEPRGGGGGKPGGVGRAPGDGATGEAIDVPLPDLDDPVVVDPVPREELKAAREELAKLPEYQHPDSQRLIEEANKQALSISRLIKDVRNQLNKGLAAGKGRDGPGTGGGEGSGVGQGTGPGIGEGTGTGKREQRVLRWTMIFNTRDGADYARQLEALGAILAVPDPGDPANYLVIRDLKTRPVQARSEDLGQIKRIYWIDDKPQSVRSLSNALGLEVPVHIVAFFPEELERKLLQLELSYRGLKEEAIKETRFEVRSARGTYEPVVVSQR
jgi:hypothetical protein